MSITPTPTLQALDDDALLERVRVLADDSRRVEADLIAHLAEVDARGLLAKHAARSLFGYCRAALNLSESEAYLRIAVARASRAHPMLLDMLADGRLHLTGAGKLAPHLTVENRDALLARATRQSKRRIEELIVELSPQPDVPARIRKLPARVLRPDTVGDRAQGLVGRCSPGTTPMSLLDASQPAATPQAALAAPRPPTAPARVAVPSPLVDAATATVASAEEPPPLPPATVDRAVPSPLLEAEIAAPLAPPLAPVAPVPAQVRPAPTAMARISPLAPSRFKVQFTASAELREKLVRLQELMRSSVGNVRLACHVHNQHLADLEYGHDWMDRCRRSGAAVASQAPSPG